MLENYDQRDSNQRRVKTGNHIHIFLQDLWRSRGTNWDASLTISDPWQNVGEIHRQTSDERDQIYIQKRTTSHTAHTYFQYLYTQKAAYFKLAKPCRNLHLMNLPTSSNRRTLHSSTTWTSSKAFHQTRNKSQKIQSIPTSQLLQSRIASSDAGPIKPKFLPQRHQFMFPLPNLIDILKVLLLVL